MSWRSVAAGTSAVLLAAAAVVMAGAEHPRPAATGARPEEQSLTSAVLSCPGTAAGAPAATSVFALGPGADGVAPNDSRLSVTAASRLASTTVGGVPVRVVIPDEAGQEGVLVTATGELAPGAAAAQLTSYSAETATGFAASWCLSPRGEWWFNGVDTSVGTTTGLVLANPNPSVAVVDLHILGPAGPVEAAGASGIAVAPGSRVLLDLARFAPGLAAVALHVTATRGMVGAAVSTTRLDGVTPTGAEWLSSSSAPTTRVVVGAGVQGLGRQSLVVTNASTRQQLVGVRILAKDGAFTSTELPDLQVPPQSVVVEDVSAIMRREATGVELTAEGPVTGSIVSEQVDDPRDFAVAGVNAALSTPAVVVVVDQTELALSFATASPAPERVEIRGVGPSGDQVAIVSLDVRPAATTTWELPTDWDVAYLVVSESRGSDLHAVASYTGAQGVAQLPVLSGRLTVTRPAVLP